MFSCGFQQQEGSLTYVHDTGVDVAELLETKKSGAMRRVIEDEGLYQSV